MTASRGVASPRIIRGNLSFGPYVDYFVDRYRSGPTHLLCRFI